MAKSLLGEKRFIGFRVRFDRLLGSFWWTPLYMITLSVLIAYSLFWLETNGFMDWFIPSNPVNPNTARPNLITVMATLISLFGVIMSVELIPFSLAVGQYGHTVVAIYMKDKGIQNVVGWFGAAIFYCASVLFITPAELTSENIPDLLYTITWIFFIGSLVVVIYFFSHVANLLSAMTVASLISKHTMEEIDRQRPWDRVIQFDPDDQRKFREKEKAIRLDGIQVRSMRSGYVTGIDYSKLVRRAQLAKVSFLILKSPGDYTAVGEPLVRYIHDKALFRPRMRFIWDKSTSTKPQKVFYQ